VAVSERLLKLYATIRDHYVVQPNRIIAEYDFLFTVKNFTSVRAYLDSSTINGLKSEFEEQKKKYSPLQRQFLIFILDHLENKHRSFDFNQYIFELADGLVSLSDSDQCLFNGFTGYVRFNGSVLVQHLIEGFLNQLKSSATSLPSGSRFITSDLVEKIFLEFSRVLLSYKTSIDLIFSAFEHLYLPWEIMQDDLQYIDDIISTCLKEEKYDLATKLAKLFNLLLKNIKPEDYVSLLRRFDAKVLAFTASIRSNNVTDQDIIQITNDLPAYEQHLPQEHISQLKQAVKTLLDNFEAFCLGDLEKFKVVSYERMYLVYQLFNSSNNKSKDDFKKWITANISKPKTTTTNTSSSLIGSLFATQKKVVSTRQAIISAFKKVTQAMLACDQSKNDWVNNPKNHSLGVTLKEIINNDSLTDEMFWKRFEALNTSLLALISNIETKHVKQATPAFSPLIDAKDKYLNIYFNILAANEYMRQFAQRLFVFRDFTDNHVWINEFNYLASIIKRLNIKLTSEVTIALNDAYIPLIGTSLTTLADLIGKTMPEIGESARSIVSTSDHKGMSHV
ncbi:MAG: hypothetical protein AB7F64_06425, partial [Gammaproteobacteria bacterium]